LQKPISQIGGLDRIPDLFLSIAAPSGAAANDGDIIAKARAERSHCFA
jgi:hypothetical protein